MNKCDSSAIDTNKEYDDSSLLEHEDSGEDGSKKEKEKPRYLQLLSRVPLISYIFVLTGTLCSTIVAAFVKITSKEVDPLQVASHRHMLIFLMAICITKFVNKYAFEGKVFM